MTFFRSRSLRKSCPAVLLTLTQCALLSAAHAGPNNYTGPNNGDFDTAGNWSLGTIPGSTDDATNTSANTVTHSTTGVTDTVNNVSFTGTGGLAISGFGGLAGAQANQGSIFSVAGPVTLSKGAILQNFTISNSNNLHFLRIPTGEAAAALQNVSLDGGLNIGDSANLFTSVAVGGSFKHGTGAVFNLGYYAVLNFLNDYTLDNATVNSLGGGTPTISGTVGHTLTLGPNLIVTGPSLEFDSAGPIINNATIFNTAGGGNSYALKPVQSTLTNNGTIGASGTGSGFTVYSSGFTNTGTVTVGKGSLMVVDGSDMVQTAGSTVVDGTMIIQEPSVNPATAYALTLQGGTLKGTGNIQGNVNNVGGTVRPGNSLGTLTISAVSAGSGGNFTQSAGGTFVENFGGATAGQFSVLNVGGIASLAGSLNIVLVAGFIPTVGQTFTFLNYASQTGAFSSSSGFFYDDRGDSYTINYGGKGASLSVASVVAAPEPSSWAALAFGSLGLAGLMIRARRRAAC